MKLRNKIALITMIAMLAFVGVGFAAWAFQNSVETSAIAPTDKVAVAVEMDETTGLHLYADAEHTIEVTALYMICDAPTVADAYLAGAGVYWAYDAAGANPVTQLYIHGALNYNAEDGVLPISTVTVQFTLTNTLALDKYVTIGAMSAPANVVVAVSNGAAVDATLVLPTLTYTSDAIDIEDVAGVTTMNTYLASHLTGNIKVSAQIISVA